MLYHVPLHAYGSLVHSKTFTAKRSQRERGSATLHFELGTNHETQPFFATVISAQPTSPTSTQLLIVPETRLQDAQE